MNGNAVMPRREFLALGAVAVGAAASAHAITGRVDSPLPFVAYVAGAAVAVGASFLIVAISDPGPPREPANPRIRLVPRWLTSRDFRLAFTSGVSANSVCFERELLDHYRLVFERR